MRRFEMHPKAGRIPPTEPSVSVGFLLQYDEDDGIIMCLSEAPDSNAVIQTHQEAHGMLPSSVMKVRQGE